MKRKTKHPLMLWHAGMSQYVWWPHGRLRFWGFAAQASSMTIPIRAEYGEHAPLYLHRVDVRTGEVLSEVPLLAGWLKARAA